MINFVKSPLFRHQNNLKLALKTLSALAFAGPIASRILAAFPTTTGVLLTGKLKKKRYNAIQKHC
jgi:hypothetical protein